MELVQGSGSPSLEDYIFFLSLGGCLIIKENAELLSPIIYPKEPKRCGNQTGFEAFNSPLCTRCRELPHVQRQVHGQADKA